MDSSWLYPTVLGLLAAGSFLVLVEHRIHRKDRTRQRADWVKFGIFALLILILLTTAQISRGVTAGLLAMIALGGAMDVHRNLEGRFRHAISMICFVFFMIALGHLLIRSGWIWPATFSLAIVFVAATDAYCQLWGRLMGKHKLCPRLSPGKTIEGLCGGLLTTVAVASMLGFFYSETGWSRLAILALFTATAAIMGDLLFSTFKRIMGIKDFSGILPGQGGVLDRFDSLIVAAPVFYWSQTWLLG